MAEGGSYEPEPSSQRNGSFSRYSRAGRISIRVSYATSIRRTIRTGERAVAPIHDRSLLRWSWLVVLRLLRSRVPVLLRPLTTQFSGHGEEPRWVRLAGLLLVDGEVPTMKYG